MNSILKYSGVVALVILAIMGIRYVVNQSQSSASFGTAVDCGSTTCFTTVGVLTSFQDDGTAIFNGAVTLAGSILQSGKALFTGGVYASSTIQTSGPLVNYTTNAATSTTQVGCIQTTATSTATSIKLTMLANGLAAGSATSTFGSGAGNGLVSWSYGTCP